MVEAPEGRDAESQIGFDSLVHHMLFESGKSGIQLSRELNRSDNFIWSTLRNNSMPRVDLLIKIANACGYEILLHGRGEEYTLRVDDGELTAWSEYDLKLTALTSVIGWDNLKAISDLLTQEDLARMMNLGITGYRWDGNAHMLYNSDGEVVMRCYRDQNENSVVEYLEGLKEL